MSTTNDNLLAQLASALPEVIAGERVTIRDGDTILAAIVPPGDLALLEAIEDAYDARVSRSVLVESPDRVSWEHIKHRLHL